MKLTGHRIGAFLRTPDASARAVLVYGPDGGLVRERLDGLTRVVVPDTADPFRVAEIPAPSLKDDPARLADEAAAIAMIGGRRVVRLRGTSDTATPVLRSFLDDPKGDALVLVEAGELGPRSTLRLLFEGADNAVALPCYADQGDGLRGLILDTLRDSGLTAEPDAVAWLVDHLGGDRLLTRSEIDKLVLYKGTGPGRVTLADAAACVGDASALGLDDLALAVADGDHAMAQRVLDRLFIAGVSPVAVLRAMVRHFQRLHLAAGLMAGGLTAERALGALKPPPHFRVADRMRAEIARWSADRLGQALDLLLSAEIDCKTTGLPAQAICGRAVLRLAGAARR